jgi:hypothetical protein
LQYGGLRGKGGARVAERLMVIEGRWLMGRIIPRQLLANLGRHLALVTPGREQEVIAAIRTQADEITEADRDLINDRPVLVGRQRDLAIAHAAQLLS